MKKTLAIIAIAATSMASFGQGYFLFGGNVSTLWNTSSTRASAGTYNVAFLWGTGTPLVSGLTGTGLATAGNGGFYTPTNTISQNTTFSVESAWTSILNDPSFRLATNSATGAAVQVANTASGGWTYNTANTFGVAGTTAGATYNVYVIGWLSAYATPQAAALAGAAVGWSSYFSYVTGASALATPLTMSGSGLTAFGVDNPSVVPEPSSIALAGLGALSLLAFRRKK